MLVVKLYFKDLDTIVIPAETVDLPSGVESSEADPNRAKANEIPDVVRITPDSRFGRPDHPDDDQHYMVVLSDLDAVTRLDPDTGNESFLWPVRGVPKGAALVGPNDRPVPCVVDLTRHRGFVAPRWRSPVTYQDPPEVPIQLSVMIRVDNHYVAVRGPEELIASILKDPDRYRSYLHGLGYHTLEEHDQGISRMQQHLKANTVVDPVPLERGNDGQQGGA